MDYFTIIIIDCHNSTLSAKYLLNFTDSYLQNLYMLLCHLLSDLGFFINPLMVHITGINWSLCLVITLIALLKVSSYQY